MPSTKPTGGYSGDSPWLRRWLFDFCMWMVTRHERAARRWLSRAESFQRPFTIDGRR